MAPRKKLPLIAVAGRPNVGKSTLFNRITGKRRALVSQEPGMTRDRRFEKAEWSGREFELVDAGGIQDEVDVITRQIGIQARKAIDAADLVLFVVDGREGITAQDQEIASFLRRSGKPVFLLANKIDAPSKFGTESEFHELGFADVFPVSAEHGLNVDVVLDRLIEKLELPAADASGREESTPIVILGKPNAGKSTFLNKIFGEERLVVSEIPGTTRDTIDVRLTYQGREYRFIDTAGIRKKGQTKTVPDKLAVIHARKSLERAEIACIMIDASEGITHQDAVVAGYAREAGKAIILLFNKMDLLDEKGRKKLEEDADYDLPFLSFAPRLFISAKTGSNVPRIFALLAKVEAAYSKRVTTSELNAFFDRSLANRFLGSYKGKPIKLKYITQIGTKPPTFVLFTSAASTLHFSHLRYLENQLRSRFGFEGTTLRIKVRTSRKGKGK